MRKQPENQDKNRWKKLSINTDDLGCSFGKLFGISIISLALSGISLVLWFLSLPEDNPTYHISELPIIPLLSTISLIGSWVGMWSSLLCYSVWSFWQLRRLTKETTRPKERNPIKRVYYFIALIWAETDNLTTYEKRLQLTIQSFMGGIFILVVGVKQ